MKVAAASLYYLLSECLKCSRHWGPNFLWCDWKALYRLLQQREEGKVFGMVLSIVKFKRSVCICMYRFTNWVCPILSTFFQEKMPSGQKQRYMSFNVAGDTDSTCSDSSNAQGVIEVLECTRCINGITESKVALFSYTVVILLYLCAGANGTCDVYWYQPLSSIAGLVSSILIGLHKSCCVNRSSKAISGARAAQAKCTEPVNASELPALEPIALIAGKRAGAQSDPNPWSLDTLHFQVGWSIWLVHSSTRLQTWPICLSWKRSGQNIFAASLGNQKTKHVISKSHHFRGPFWKETNCEKANTLPENQKAGERSKRERESEWERERAEKKVQHETLTKKSSFIFSSPVV